MSAFQRDWIGGRGPLAKQQARLRPVPAAPPRDLRQRIAELELKSDYFSQKEAQRLRRLIARRAP